MKEPIIDEDTINLKALSERNGKSEIENFKMIIQFLSVKAEVTGETQKVVAKF